MTEFPEVGTRIRWRLNTGKDEEILIYGIYIGDGKAREEFALPGPVMSAGIGAPSDKKRGEEHKLLENEPYEMVTERDWLIAAVNDPEVEVGEYCPRCGEQLPAAPTERVLVEVGLVHANCVREEDHPDPDYNPDIEPPPTSEADQTRIDQLREAEAAAEAETS